MARITKLGREIKRIKNAVEKCLQDTKITDKEKADAILEMMESVKNEKIKFQLVIDYWDYNRREMEVMPIITLDGHTSVKLKFDLDDVSSIQFAITYTKGNNDISYHYITDYSNSNWELLSYLADFSEVLDRKPTDSRIEKWIPVRWCGAFFTGAGGKDASFEESFDWETSQKKREVAAQLFESVEHISDAFEQRDRDSIDYCKLGIIYDPEDIVEAYDTDVWSMSIGPILMPTRYIYNEWHPKYTDIYWTDLLGNCLQYIFGNKWREYFDENENFNNISNIEDYINLMFSEEEFEVLKNAHDNIMTWAIKKVAKELSNITKLEDSNKNGESHVLHIKDEHKRKIDWHNEVFIKVGAKPQGIVVRGTISPEKYEIVQKMAIKKGLYILHV